MLEQMRRHSRSTFIYVLFGMLIAVFVLTFNTAARMGGQAGNEAEVMAEVGTTSIDGADLSLAMLLSVDPPVATSNQFEKLQAEQQYEKYRLRYAGGVPEAAGLTPHLGKPSSMKLVKVMAELIEGALAAEDAKARGLAVSDTELAKRVANLQRTFGQELTDENGNFEPRKYDQFVRYRLGTSKASLEDFLRREILRDKMAQIVTQGIVVTAEEVDALHQSDRGRPRLEVLAIDAVAAAKAITVTAAEAEAWAAEHADAVGAEYAAQASKYKVPDKFNVRGILVAAPNGEDETDPAKKDAAATERASKRTAAAAIKADLDKAWAGEVKLDPVAPPSDDPDKPAQAVGEAKTATEVTGDEKDQRLLQYFSKVAGEKTEDSIYKENGGKYVEDYDAEKLERQPFGPAVKAAVTAAQAGQLLGPVEGKKGWWILVVEKKIAGKETGLADARVEVAQSLLQKERGEKEMGSLAAAIQLAAQATPTTPLSQVVKDWCKKKGLPEDALMATETPPLGKSPIDSLQDLSALFGMMNRTDDPEAVPGVGKHPEMAAAARQLQHTAPIAGKVFESEDKKTRYVVRLANDATADAKADAKSRDSLLRTLTGIRRQEAYRGYAQKLLLDATKAGKVKKSAAWELKVKEEQARQDDVAKKAAADTPKAPEMPQMGGMPGSAPQMGGPGAPSAEGKPGTIQLNVGGKPVEVKLDSQGKPSAPIEAAPAPGAPPAAGDAPAK